LRNEKIVAKMLLMGEKMMNVDVAAGWLQYAGMPLLRDYHIDQAGSTILHTTACDWASSASGEFNPSRQLRVELGDCHLPSGSFAGRFLLVKINSFWNGGGYAIAASAHTAGGDRNAGSCFLVHAVHAKLLVEDISRALTLPQNIRLEALKTSIKKWENLNPEGRVNPFAPRPRLFKKIIRTASSWFFR
jgi:hypothetical protein